jgi:hypothetical protein
VLRELGGLGIIRRRQAGDVEASVWKSLDCLSSQWKAAQQRISCIFRLSCPSHGSTSYASNETAATPEASTCFSSEWRCQSTKHDTQRTGKESRQLRLEREILKTGLAFFAKGPAGRLRRFTRGRRFPCCVDFPRAHRRRVETGPYERVFGAYERMKLI